MLILEYILLIVLDVGESTSCSIVRQRVATTGLSTGGAKVLFLWGKWHVRFFWKDTE